MPCLWTTRSRARVGKKHEALLSDIKATGYDGVEIPVFDGTADDYRRLGDLLDRIGLERTAVSAMGDPAMNLISPDAAVRKAGIDYVKRCIDFSEALGAKFLSGPLHSTLGHFSGIRPDRRGEEALGIFAARHRRPCRQEGRDASAWKR